MQVPALMQYFKDVIGVPLADCLKTLNWGVGYYIFAPETQADKILKIGKAAGYDLMDIGAVEEGKRQTIFEPGNIVLSPPGE